MNDMVTQGRPADGEPRTGEIRGTFEPDQLDGLPAPAVTFLRHAIAPATPLPQRVSLTMHGHIKVMGIWLPFRAD